MERAAYGVPQSTGMLPGVQSGPAADALLSAIGPQQEAGGLMCQQRMKRCIRASKHCARRVLRLEDSDSMKGQHKQTRRTGLEKA